VQLFIFIHNIRGVLYETSLPAYTQSIQRPYSSAGIIMILPTGFFQSIARTLSHAANDYDKKRDKDIADGTHIPLELSPKTEKVVGKVFKYIYWFIAGIFIWFFAMGFLAMVFG